MTAQDDRTTSALDDTDPAPETHIERFSVYPTADDFHGESTHYEENQDLTSTLGRGGHKGQNRAAIVLVELNPDDEEFARVSVEARGYVTDAHLDALDKAITHLMTARNHLDRLTRPKHHERMAFAWGREAEKAGL